MSESSDTGTTGRVPPAAMATRSAHRGGIQLSILGLGTMTFGAESDEQSSRAILDTYYEAGGRFIDTADVYSRGVSEEIIGRWLADRSPSDVVLATKARFSMGDGPDDQGAGRSHILKAVDASLRRLGLEQIDIYQMHAWDPAVPIEETFETLNELVQAGKVRFIGVSNYTGWQLERAVQTTSRNDWPSILTLQPQYNLLAREIELDALPVCLDHGIGVLAWSPLAGGWLTGKYQEDRRPSGATRLGEDPNRGVEAYDLRSNPRTWSVVDEVASIADQRGVSMAEVSLNWLMSRSGVTSVLVGCRTPRQLEANLGALEWTLDEAEVAALTEVSAPGVPSYPHGFLEKYAGMDVWKKLGTRVEPVI